MKHIYYLLVIAALLWSCSGQKPSTSQGLIPNPSAEEMNLSVEKDWTAEARARDAILFYDYISHEGKKSLTIHSDRPANGRWLTKVQLKPWSKYRFTGWVKTENIVAMKGKGAGFRLDAFNIEYPGLAGTNDWTKLEFEFETGNDDSSVLSCLMNVDGIASGRAWFDDMNLELISSDVINTSVQIDIAQTKEPMSQYIYGQFIEHLGKCIYGGIWAEMLEDRKFWFTPGDRESPWRINGNKALFAVDKTAPFVGEQTPVLSADLTGAASMQQSGLGLKPDLDYTGRIILKATPEIKAVDVILRWGDKSQTATITDLTGSYETYPLDFHSGELNLNASIEIMPSGTGKVWIGTVSLMPSDNIEGFRPDVIALLRELNAPVYRWPGGNFVSGYNWRDGIGDRDKRPPRKNPAWQGVEHNDVGIHEFMTFCKLLDTEPYIAVNAGLGNSEQAKQEVEYCNGGSETP
ncbi:MAG TPA: hypothetical protein VMV74_05600, partial [Bacteroidales bacterium]|nr:hypothetical protein [Bacteroidales bacterium]